MFDLVAIIISYLIGSIPFGLIIARLTGIKDIRQLGSGNIGATNVWRAAGFKVAVWVFIGDIGKGVLAVLIAKYYVSNFNITIMTNDLYFIVCGVAAILGHVFPVYLLFKGGKGVNTTLGAILMLLPLETLICFMVFILTVLITRYISLGSMIGALSMVGVILIERMVFKVDLDIIYLYLSAVLAIMIVITHRQNIKRLLSGSENKFSFSAKSKVGGHHA